MWIGVRDVPYLALADNNTDVSSQRSKFVC